jgi:hypothetical protein
MVSGVMPGCNHQNPLVRRAWRPRRQEGACLFRVASCVLRLAALLATKRDKKRLGEEGGTHRASGCMYAFDENREVRRAQASCERGAEDGCWASPAHLVGNSVGNSNLVGNSGRQP